MMATPTPWALSCMRKALIEAAAAQYGSQPGKPAVVAVHKEHHAQTKQSRMLGNHAPHQHFRGTRQGRLRVEYAADEQP